MFFMGFDLNAELLKLAGVEEDYAGLSEADKLRVLLAELAQPRLLRSPYLDYSELVKSELGVLEAARVTREKFGARAVRNYIISHTETVSDLVEVMLLQKETGLLDGLLGDLHNPAKAGLDLDHCPLWIRPEWEQLGWRFEASSPQL